MFHGRNQLELYAFVLCESKAHLGGASELRAGTQKGVRHLFGRLGSLG